MKTTCYLCGQTDDSDLLYWARDDVGWKHKTCKNDLVVRIGGGIVLAVTLNSTKIVRSIDGGTTWYLMCMPCLDGMILSLEHHGSGIVTAKLADGRILRSIDHGITWSTD